MRQLIESAHSQRPAEVALNDAGLRVPRLRYGALADFWRDHGIALLLYAALSVALSWPTALHFTTRITTSGEDAMHNLWLFWHTREAMLGRQPFFAAPLLYYPRGISLLLHGVGPITGLFALPFWFWGPEAAYNGALLISLFLTGYCTYLLARGLELNRGIALFAGIMVQSSPMAVAGLNNHVTKVFLGAIPLALLALHHALDPRRRRWWTVAVALGALLTLLHNGYQFVFLMLAFGFLMLAELITAKGYARWFVLKRSALIALCGLVLVAPLLLAIERAAADPLIGVDVNSESSVAPDLLQYILPWHQSRIFGPWTTALFQPYQHDRAILLNSETSVSLALIGVILCGVAWLRSPRPARRWVLLLAVFVLFSLGPSLHLLSRTRFTEYNLPIILPYAFLTELPGLDFMRAPGRFMMLGFVAFGIAAAFGLQSLTERFPRYRHALVLAAMSLVLIQNWPQPMRQDVLPPVPAFYQQLAQDPEQYGVFDLPLKSSPNFGFNWTTVWTSSFYQIFQMTHHKGIASGYISRTYIKHPIFDDVMNDHMSQLLIDGQPAAYHDMIGDLLRNNYRYVVLHKGLFGPHPQGIDPGEKRAREFLNGVFAGQAPVADDSLITAYRVQPPTSTLTLRWGEGWRDAEDQWRWTQSPATLTITSSGRQTVRLEITPAAIHDPSGEHGLGSSGVLNVQVGAAPPVAVAINVDRPTSVPITLDGGEQTINLSLEAGNFRPSDYGQHDDATLSFAVRSINLVNDK